jgi:hypothetical protein
MDVSQKPNMIGYLLSSAHFFARWSVVVSAFICASLSCSLSRNCFFWGVCSMS